MSIKTSALPLNWQTFSDMTWMSRRDRHTTNTLTHQPAPPCSIDVALLRWQVPLSTQLTWRHTSWRDVTCHGVTSHVPWRDVAWFSDSVRYLLACCYDFGGFVEEYEVWVWYSFAVVAAFRAPNTFSHYTLHLQSCMNGMLLSINLVFSLNMTSLKICWFLNIWVPVTQGWNIFCFASLKDISDCVSYLR